MSPTHAEWRNRGMRGGRAAAMLLLAGCAVLGAPPMEPLTALNLEAARERWAAQGAAAYHLVVRVRPPRADPAVYDVEVEHGVPVGIERDGTPVGPEEIDRADYSVAGLFDFLQRDLAWTTVDAIGDTPAIDLRAEFEPATGRLVRYRRTVGTGRRRVLLVEVLAYQPVPILRAGSAAPGTPAGRGT